MRKRVLVTGGAGFLGSHLCERMLADGAEVICLDSFITGDLRKVGLLVDHPRFSVVDRDVSGPLGGFGPLTAVAHLASPASPPAYLAHPIDTLRAGSVGTLNALELAREAGATFLLASTSEVYGDPQVHPQPEAYRGNVSTTGPRGVYDEAKRFAEAPPLHMAGSTVLEFTSRGSSTRTGPASAQETGEPFRT